MTLTKRARSSKGKTAESGIASDNTADHWNLLSPKALKRPGATLLALLLRSAHARGITPRELAENHLGLSYAHFNSLRKGHRPISGLGNESIEKIAAFLGRPKVVVMLAANTLQLADFFQSPELLDQNVDAALQFIHSDPDAEMLMPVSAFGVPADLRRYIVRLYEQATGKILLPARVGLKDIIQTVEQMRVEASGADGQSNIRSEPQSEISNDSSQ